MILVDYTNLPPAKIYADEHIKESTLDREKVLEIAQNRKAALVISTCVDQANATCCYVSEKLGIPTSRYVYVCEADEFAGIKLSYPLMVKPADSNSTNGVKKAENWKELNRHFKNALKFSRNGMVIVEEFICFDLSEEGIKRARKNAEEKGMSDRILFLNEDFFTSCYANEVFDMVFWDNSLHHMTDTTFAVQKSYDILQEGGIFF